MPKKSPKQKNTKSVKNLKAGKFLSKKGKPVDGEELVPVIAVHEELDPEVLEALNVKKKSKKTQASIDYIPELERDEFALDLDDE